MKQKKTQKNKKRKKTSKAIKKNKNKKKQKKTKTKIEIVKPPLQYNVKLQVLKKKCEQQFQFFTVNLNDNI